MQTPKYAVVTGASSGIGSELARNLSARGYGLILVARREDRLKALAEELKSPVEIFTADLSQEKECLRLIQFVENFNLHVFINNAGFGDCGSFASTNLEKELQMIDVNVRALHILSKFAISLMEKNGGYLMNVGSSAGLLPAGPYMAAYYASKAYVVSLTQAIAVELQEKKSKVHASVLCPGPVNTEFNDVANVRFALSGISAKTCADYALQQMFRRQVVIVPGMLMKLATVAGKILPRRLTAILTGMQQKKKFR